MSISFVFVGARIYYLSQVDHGIADAEPASGAGKSSIPIAITFATILKQCRTELGLTQAQLAARAAISLSLLRKYESGARLPPLAMAVRLADALGLRGEERGALLDAVRFQRLPATNAGNGASAGGVLHTRLPVAPTPLLGREAALSELTRLIRSGSTRLITLVGPPGVGKSRLALAATWAAQSTFVDGAYFVELAELDDPSAVAAKIALRLGITGEDVEAAILSFLSQRSLLLCLDNFEHLTTAAPLLARILAVAPGIIILVTSRVPLRLRAETRVRVKPLALPTKRHLSAVVSAPAIRLFCERARAVEPSFTLNAANVEAVTSLCHFLDGVPLAIELAAARIDTLEPAAILAGLRDNLDDLDSGFADLPAHQRSLNATIAWSERMLSPVAQLSFARLGVFRGAFDATAADALGVAELDQLVEAGLVQSGERGQFRLLETIRVYADTRLQNLPDSAVTYLRHAAHYAAFAEAAGPMLEGASAASILGQIDDNLPNLRAAIR
ncbi:ATP-binding protein, partial [Chloroflexus sp.]|uniref:ATP-binding protein n=1 Tax=Chloroflexus sp. TaxID=1904827 RepID=UPI0026307E1A